MIIMWKEMYHLRQNKVITVCVSEFVGLKKRSKMFVNKRNWAYVCGWENI